MKQHPNRPLQNTGTDMSLSPSEQRDNVLVRHQADLRLALCLLTCISLAACPSCEEPPRGDISESATLRFWSNQQHVGPVDEQQEALWVWGFQGGTMVRPEIVFYDDVEIYEGEELEIVIRNEVLPDSEKPDAFDPAFGEYRMRGLVVADNETGALTLGPFDNQLGWDSLAGLNMRFSVEVSTFTGDLTFEVQLVDILSREVEKCSAFRPAQASSPDDTCVYVTLPGSVVIADVETVNYIDACGEDAALVYGSFLPEDPAASACLDAYVAIGWPDPTFESFPVELPLDATQSCLAENGVEAGAENAAEYVMGVVGYCNPPVALYWTEDLSACECRSQ